MAGTSSLLPPLAPFPEAAWRNRLVPEEWEACLDAWVSIAGAHLSRSPSDFNRLSAKDESLPIFLTSYVSETAADNEASSSIDGSKGQLLRKLCFLLSYKLLDGTTSSALTQWEFLADFSKVYGRRQGGKIFSMLFKKHSEIIHSVLGTLKASLIKELEAGLKGDLKTAELQLKKLNHLLHSSPDAAEIFVAGSDFLDSLISCYKIMNPPLRKAIISTTYLCVIGLIEDEKPRISSLIDQLYSLEAAAKAHKEGPTNVNDSLVAELVTATPILKQVQQRIASSGTGSGRANSVIASLETFKKAGVSQRPPPKSKKRIDKGKGRGVDGDKDEFGQASHGIHIHRMSLITQIQDLFPDLGSGFVMKLLEEYDENVETVISHLLEDSLPTHLQNRDRTEALEPPSQSSNDYAPHLKPSTTPPVSNYIPQRRNVFDDDDFDKLTMNTSRLHFGRRNPNATADDVLEDRTTAPSNAAILAALASFDSDDDERDDSYDVEDVGGTVDSVNPEDGNITISVKEGQDELLFGIWKSSKEAFGRDAATRRSKARTDLRELTGMTDEAIEGWAVMLSRDPRQQRRLEAKLSAFGGEQRQLQSTSWKAPTGGSGTEDSDVDPTARGRGGRLLRGGGRGRGRGRGSGNVAGPAGERDTETARRGKEANKGSRANHNRRDQRAKKMARGGGMAG